MPIPTDHSAAVTLIMRRRFSLGGITRSPEYRAGCQAALMRGSSGQTVHCPHLAGSSAFDAFWAGVDEGARLWQREGALVLAELAAPMASHARPACSVTPDQRRRDDLPVPHHYV